MDTRPIPHSWLDPRTEIRPSPIGGHGLFAQERIAAGEIVERWGGIRITDAELAQIAATLPRYNSAAIGEGVNLLLALDDPIGFGNHSCDPNLWMHDAITVEARRSQVIAIEAVNRSYGATQRRPYPPYAAVGPYGDDLAPPGSIMASRGPHGQPPQASIAPSMQPHLAGKQVVKVIVAKGKLVSVVVR